MDKKTKRIIILILLVIIVLILLESIIRLIASTTKKIVDNHNQKVEQKEYEQTEKYQKEVYLESCIEKAIDLIKSGDYEMLYSLLDPVYKEYMEFDDIDEFKKYMSNYMGDINSLELIEYKKSSERYVCTFKIFNDAGTVTKKALIEEKKNVKDEYNFSIIFDEINYIKGYKEKVQKTSNDINYQVKYRLKYPDYSVYIVKITNQKNKDVKLSLEDSYIYKTNKKEYYPENKETLSNLNIKAGETINIQFKLNDASSHMYEENYMYINPNVDGIKDDQKAIKIDMSTNYYE